MKTFRYLKRPRLDVDNNYPHELTSLGIFFKWLRLRISVWSLWTIVTERGRYEMLFEARFSTRRERGSDSKNNGCKAPKSLKVCAQTPTKKFTDNSFLSKWCRWYELVVPVDIVTDRQEIGLGFWFCEVFLLPFAKIGVCIYVVQTVIMRKQTVHLHINNPSTYIIHTNSMRHTDVRQHLISNFKTFGPIHRHYGGKKKYQPRTHTNTSFLRVILLSYMSYTTASFPLPATLKYNPQILQKRRRNVVHRI